MAITKPLDNAQIPADASIAPVMTPVEDEPILVEDDPVLVEDESLQVAGGWGALKGLRGTDDIPTIREGVEQRKIPTSTADEAAGIITPSTGPVDPGRPSARDPSLRNINFQHLDTTDNALRLIDEISNQGDHFVVNRRGVRTVDQAKADAAEVDLEKLLGRPIGSAFNDAEVIAIRSMLVESAERLQNAAGIVRMGNATEADMLAFRQMVAHHAGVQSLAAGAAAEAGRTLNAFKVTAQSGMLQVEQLRQALNSAGGVKTTVKLAEMIDDAADPAAVAAAARAAHKATSVDMVLEYWINGLLSNPTTHTVNMTSNTVVALWQVPERFLAATISKVTPGTGVRFGEAAAQSFGIIQGFRDGLRLAWRALKTGEPSDAAQKYEARKYRAITADNVSKVLGKASSVVGLSPRSVANGGAVARGVDLLGEAVRIPGRFLGAEDEFFKAVGYRMELNALAYRQAAEEGLTGHAAGVRIHEIVNNPPESIHLDAMHIARVQTFTNELGAGGQKYQALVRELPILRFITPFIRTPTNIVKFVGTRSPLAPFAKSFRADIKAGGARRDLALARMSMGTMMFLAIAPYVASGDIIGNLSNNKGVRDAQRRKGMQPYSIRFGDQLYAFNRLDPIGMFLGLTADAMEVIKYSDQDGADEVILAIAVALAQNLSSRTYVRGLSDLNNAIHDPKRYAKSYLTRMAATFVPYTSLVAQVERVIDPTMRETRGEDIAQTVINRIWSRTPGLSKDLMPIRTLWGDHQVLGGALGWDMVSPIYNSTIEPSLADDEIIENEMSITKPRESFSISRKAGKRSISATVELNPAEYDQYIWLAAGRDKRAQIDGRTLKEYLEHVVIPSKEYQEATPGPDGVRTLIFRRIVTMYREAAKGVLLEDNPGLAGILQQTLSDNLYKLRGK